MKKARLLKLVAIFLVIILAGCSASINSSRNQNDVQPETIAKKNISVEKLWNIKVDDDNEICFTHEGSIYYKKSGLYGVMSLDGKSDTGAVYTYLEESYGSVNRESYPYYVVSDRKEGNDVASLNIKGLIDIRGNEIIPQKYAIISVLNEKYANAFALVEPTDWISSGKYFKINGIYYRADVYTYDLATGQIVFVNKCVADEYGNRDFITDACGNFLVFDNSGHAETVDGKVLPQGATLFVNGSYAYNGVVYDTNGKKIFEYSKNDYVPVEMISDYIEYRLNRVDKIADYYFAQTTQDGTGYLLLDTSGNAVSDILPGKPQLILGELLFIDGEIYNFKGKKIISGKFTNVYYEEEVGDCWVLINAITEDDTQFTYIDNKGNVIYKCTVNDNSNVQVSPFYPYIVYDTEKKKTFCFADKDFTISGTPEYIVVEGVVEILAHTWFGVQSEKSQTVDVFTGEVLDVKGEFVETCTFDGDKYLLMKENDGTISVYKIKREK